MRKILVSACLYGECACRYDGGNAPLLDPMFLKWKAEGRLVPFCPEVFGGLPTPRSPAERRDSGVFTQNGTDVTAAYTKGAEEMLRRAREENVCFCILKADSPSCGSKRIYDGSFTGRKIPGNGLAVACLKNAGFTVFDENDMAEAVVLDATC